MKDLHCGNRDFRPFCSCDLDLDPMTFVYEADPYSLETYRMCENKLPTSRLSVVIVSQTGRQTDTTEIVYNDKLITREFHEPLSPFHPVSSTASPSEDSISPDGPVSPWSPFSPFGPGMPPGITGGRCNINTQFREERYAVFARTCRYCVHCIAYMYALTVRTCKRNCNMYRAYLFHHSVCQLSVVVLFPSPRPYSGTHCRWMSSHPIHSRSSEDIPLPQIIS